MTLSIKAAAALALVGAFATPAFASDCGDRIASLEQSLNKEGAAAGAASSAGQGVAAARSQKAIEAKQSDKPVSEIAKPPSPANMEATQQAAQAGTAGEDVMAAKVTLNDAKNADKKGDEKACNDAVAKAMTQMKR